MGKNRSTERHPQNVLAVFVAGLIFMMGVHSSFNIGPALKPQRLERLHSSETVRKAASSPGEKECRNRDKPDNLCLSSWDQSFSGMLLSLHTTSSPASVSNTLKGRNTLPVQTARYPKAASPRGPPVAIS
jgi:hypothetical protein